METLVILLQIHKSKVPNPFPGNAPGSIESSFYVITTSLSARMVRGGSMITLHSISAALVTR